MSEMTNSNNFKGTRIPAVTVLLAVLLATLVLAPVAGAQTMETASFPGTSGSIAFTSDRDDPRNWNIYRMHADGFGQTRLTNTPGLDITPEWSADGKKITYTNFVIGGTPGEIYQVDADGTDEKNLTNSSSWDENSSYSPASSNTVAFDSNRTDNQYDVYLATLGPDGPTTELIRITRSEADDYMPAISPDGRRLAFVSDRDGDDDIYVMKLAPEGPTNVPVKLTKNTRPDPNGPPYMIDWQPDWSPDGAQITFSSKRTVDANYEIYRMKASPEGKRNKPINLSKSPARDEAPAWSPDGKKIAFQSDRPAADGTTDAEIWHMRATDGANPVNLTDAPGNDFYPAWQPLP
jgi:Tol biopolymer transport system component